MSMPNPALIMVSLPQGPSLALQPPLNPVLSPLPPNPVFSPPSTPVVTPPLPSPVISPPPKRSPTLTPPRAYPPQVPVATPPASKSQPPVTTPLPPQTSTSPPQTSPSPLSSSPPTIVFPLPPSNASSPPVKTTPPLLNPQPPFTSPPISVSPIPPEYSPPPRALPLSPPTPLKPQPFANGSSHNRSGKSHTPTGLISGCALAAVLLLCLCVQACLCWKSKRNGKHRSRKYHETVPDLELQLKALGQSRRNALPPMSHVIKVLPEPSAPPLPSNRANYGLCAFEHQAPAPILGPSCGTFTYDELVVATNGFSDSNLIGQGGFGYVHKGILSNGQVVAVKQLKEDSRQGEREFRAEVEIISRVHHKHLVSLVGFCIDGPDRLLVYEFVPNDNLGFHLHGNEQPSLEWDTRLKIAIGTAKGLAYLHEDCNPTIIHRDIKAANILLDHHFDAKVSDFGLAKTFSSTNTIVSHISTRVMGTFGYLAPEYAASGHLTDRSDVYSFGVVLLELITGRPPVSGAESQIHEGLVSWARPLLIKALKDDEFNALVDPLLVNSYDKTEVANMAACAVACLQHPAHLRPKMSQIARALEGNIHSNSLSGMNRLMDSTLYTSRASNTAQGYKNIDELNESLSRNANHSLHSGTTSEYGLNPSTSSGDSD